MTEDAWLIVRFLFSYIWKYFTMWYIPGTHTTPAAFFLFLAVTGIVLRFIMRVTITYEHKEDNSYKQDNNM